MFVQKYINSYYNKSITKCVANAIQISRLFLGVSNKVKSSLLAMALSINNLILLDLVRKREERTLHPLSANANADNKLIRNELKNRFDINE